MLPMEELESLKNNAKVSDDLKISPTNVNGQDCLVDSNEKQVSPNDQETLYYPEETNVIVNEKPEVEVGEGDVGKLAVGFAESEQAVEQTVIIGDKTLSDQERIKIEVSDVEESTGTNKETEAKDNVILNNFSEKTVNWEEESAVVNISGEQIISTNGIQEEQLKKSPIQEEPIAVITNCSSAGKEEPQTTQKHKSSSHDQHRENKDISSKSSHRSRSHRHESNRSSSSRRHRTENRRIQCHYEDIIYEALKLQSWKQPRARVPWRPHALINKLRYRRHYRIAEDDNGGALVAHLYTDELQYMFRQQLEECALEFIKLSYSEDENNCAHFVIGVVHNAADYLPDLVDYMADHYPSLTVKMGSLGGRDSHSTTMAEYRHHVYRTYWNGTFRFAPLDELSICGVSGEEAGAYFPDFVARLESSPFMKPVMPWSSLSVVHTDNPRESNDGPIFWVRPGEQMIPASEALKDPKSKKRRCNELYNLVVGLSRISDARESLFMDRTRPHADQIGVDGGITNTAPTAAVGVLKAVLCGHKDQAGRAAKDVIAFDAKDYDQVVADLKLDLYEPPQTQCTKWLEVGKLNSMRREGIRFAHLQLHDGDVYYLPRKVVHQFQTISAVASVAWHHRYREYFRVGGAPNLHMPTGLNKGQVFYELPVVAEYKHPPADRSRSESRSRSNSPTNDDIKDKNAVLKKLTPKKAPSPYKREHATPTKTLSTPVKNLDKTETPEKLEIVVPPSSEKKEENENNVTPVKRRLSDDTCKSAVLLNSPASSVPHTPSAKKRKVKPPNPDVLGAIFAEMEQKKHLFD